MNKRNTTRTDIKSINRQIRERYAVLNDMDLKDAELILRLDFRVFGFLVICYRFKNLTFKTFLSFIICCLTLFTQKCLLSEIFT